METPVKILGSYDKCLTSGEMMLICGQQSLMCTYVSYSHSKFYSDSDILNYKSLDSYQNFVKGWVRQVLVRAVRNKRIIIGMVRLSLLLVTTLIAG